ncbi:MAG TPA: 4-hydroxythreonine-4-phosphate dehydrogenase PdxA [Bacteroidota bacterium]|nr:4-hydroxythreonine-4-phosphate dehydrogenase PdxA [Bacteroidota bacterium]
MKCTLALTVGDFNGIGPEIILKSITHPSFDKDIQPVLLGSADVFDYYAQLLKLPLTFQRVDAVPAKPDPSSIPVIDTFPVTLKNIQIGKIAPDAGKCAGTAIERAVQLCLKGEVDAMVTAPVSKESLHYAGYNFPGQTEMLAMLSRSSRVTMMLMAKSVRIGLVTIHLPIADVAQNIFQERIVEKLETINESLTIDFGIEKPIIAVLGLNPHAGENGSIGREEKDIIIPAIAKARIKGIGVEGPFAADGFFGTKKEKKFDAVLAMYHDQGLIPLKMSGFHDGVNYSAGLKIIRTSPDHGTAFDLAGKGKANPQSMLAAITTASTIISNRKNNPHGSTL